MLKIMCWHFHICVQFFRSLRGTILLSLSRVARLSTIFLFVCVYVRFSTFHFVVVNYFDVISYSDIWMALLRNDKMPFGKVEIKQICIAYVSILLLHHSLWFSVWLSTRVTAYQSKRYVRIESNAKCTSHILNIEHLTLSLAVQYASYFPLKWMLNDEKWHIFHFSIFHIVVGIHCFNKTSTRNCKHSNELFDERLQWTHSVICDCLFIFFFTAQVYNIQLILSRYKHHVLNLHAFSQVSNW